MSNMATVNELDEKSMILQQRAEKMGKNAKSLKKKMFWQKVWCCSLDTRQPLI